MTSDLNERFHTEYDEARVLAEGRAPVLVVLVDLLVSCRNGRRDEHVITLPAFATLKAVAHGPIALFALVQRMREQASPSSRALEAIRAAALDVRGSLGDLRPDMQTCCRAVLDSTIAFVDDTKVENVDVAALMAAFARGVGPALLRLTELATELQMESLHRAVETAIASFTAEERDHVYIVVSGDHQARQRSLAMQYFAQRLKDAPHADERLTYGEAITSVDEAMRLVGTQRLDRAIAKAFFGDQKRLQRDILGDAATSYLHAKTFPRL